MEPQPGSPAGEPSYEVVSPLGTQHLEGGANLPQPLETLDGKKIAELWDWLYKGDVLFPIVREELRKRYPKVEFVEYPVFGNVHGADENEIVRQLPARLKELGCDAAVVGVGH